MQKISRKPRNCYSQKWATLEKTIKSNLPFKLLLYYKNKLKQSLTGNRKENEQKLEDFVTKTLWYKGLYIIYSYYMFFE